MAVAKFHAIGDEVVDAEVSGERAHDVVEKLPDENYALAAANDFQEFFGGGGAELGFEDVVEIFLTEEIEAILADAAQQRVEKTGGEGAIGRVDEWT